MKRQKPEKLWTLGFVNLLAFDITYQFGCYMTNTIISVYAVALGATYVIAGLLAGLCPGASMLARPITGFITDLFSKKSLLVTSTVMFLLATLGCAFLQSFVLIGICRVLQGLSFALRSVCVVSLTARVVPRSRLGSGMGWMGLSSTLSNAVGPLIAETVGAALGYQVSFFGASMVMTVGFVLALLFKNPQKKEEGGIGRGLQVSFSSLRTLLHWRNFIYRRNIMLAVIAGLSGVPQGISVSLIILAATQAGIEGAPLYFTFYALAALVGRPVMGRLADTVGARKITVPLFLLELIGVTILAFMVNTWMIIVAAAILGIGQGSLYSVFQAEAVRGVNAAEAGRAANTFYIGPDINMCLSPIIGSVLLGAYGVGALYAFGGVAVVGAIILFICWEKLRSR